VKGLGPRSSAKQQGSTIEDGFQKIGSAMPTLLRINGYQFYFYAEEGNEPPHIHVAKGGFDAKFWLSPAQLAVNHGFRPHDLREIADIIEQHEQLILEKWNEFFRP
jgi:hypothetical protein